MNHQSPLTILTILLLIISNSPKINSSPIKTVVVVVMENRSFDHMLGWMKKLNPEINGVDGTEWNRLNASGPNSEKLYFKDESVYVDPDPGHSFQAIREQIFGSNETSSEKPPPMSGFAQQAFAMDNTSKMARDVMNGFRPDSVAVYSSLVSQFAVFDRYHLVSEQSFLSADLPVLYVMEFHTFEEKFNSIVEKYFSENLKSMREFYINQEKAIDEGLELIFSDFRSSLNSTDSDSYPDETNNPNCDLEIQSDAEADSGVLKTEIPFSVTSDEEQLTEGNQNRQEEVLLILPSKSQKLKLPFEEHVLGLWKVILGNQNLTPPIYDTGQTHPHIDDKPNLYVWNSTFAAIIQNWDSISTPRITRIERRRMKVLPLILLGCGGVGCQLLLHIISCRSLHAKQGVHLRVVGVSDSKSLVVASDVLTKELDDKFLSEICRVKLSGSSLSTVGENDGCLVYSDLELKTKVIDIAALLGKSTGLAFVDCSASSDTIGVLNQDVDLGCCVVLANKKPLTSSSEDYDKLVSSPRRIRHESTVGAGLPVIAYLNRIISSGDHVDRIVGSLSGAREYVMSEVEDGKPLSEVVKTAKSLGYTEPDPRDDLSGMDVARKAMIFARLLGRRIDLDSLKIESLYPGEMGPNNMSVEEFLSSGIVLLDNNIQERVEKASAKGNVLRYVCVIEASRCEVGLQELPKSSALGRLRGSDNVLEICSRCYKGQSLLIQGAGEFSFAVGEFSFDVP